MCLFSTKDDHTLWHKCLEHVNAKHLTKLVNQNLVFGLPKLSFSKEIFYDAC